MLTGIALRLGGVLRRALRPVSSYVCAVTVALLVLTPTRAQDQVPAPASAPAGSRQPPPVEQYPRTRAAYEAFKMESEAEWASRPGDTFPEKFPEYAEEFRAFVARTIELDTKYTATDIVYNEAMADELISELFTDHGNPDFNYKHLVNVADWIGYAARLGDDRLPPAVRRKLTNGLIEFVRAGGGQHSPTTQARFAVTLGRLARDDPAASLLADGLLADALRWGQEIYSSSDPDDANDLDRRALERIHNFCSQRWGADYLLEVYALGAGPLPPDPPRRYLEALELLKSLLARPLPASAPAGEHFRRLREATEAALADFQEPRFEEDLTARLLIVYRGLLEQRPPIFAEASEYIDRELTRLAASSRRLTRDHHWRCGARPPRRSAASALPSSSRRWFGSCPRMSMPPRAPKRRPPTPGVFFCETSGTPPPRTKPPGPNSPARTERQNLSQRGESVRTQASRPQRVWGGLSTVV